MKPFRDRNPTAVGLVGLTVILVALVGAFRADRLPIIGSGDVYAAEFAEAGALTAGDEVRIAGVTVGKVRSIELQGTKVRVEFVLHQDSDLGSVPGAEIRIRTLLGDAFLALLPSESGTFAEGSTIPLTRTTAPYDVVQAFSDLSVTTDAIDTEQLATALETIGEVTGASTEEFGAAISSLSTLSANLAGRDAEINDLLTSLVEVSAVLDSRSETIETLLIDSSTLTAAITARRDAIHQLLVATQDVSTGLTALVGETEADLQPALIQLESITDSLARNVATLDEILRIGPTFVTLFTQVLGTGPWFDGLFGIGLDVPQ